MGSKATFLLKARRAQPMVVEPSQIDFKSTETFTYVGETDSEGKACGKGVVVDPSCTKQNKLYYGKEVKYEGTFLNDKLEGKCVITIDNRCKLIAEFKEGQYFGKSTYYSDGIIYNSLKQGDVYIQRPTRQEHAFYASDGAPIMAMQMNENPLLK